MKGRYAFEHGHTSPGAPEIVQVHDAFDAPLVVDDDDRRDLALFEEVQRLDGQRRALMAIGFAVITSRAVSSRTFDRGHLPAQVAVRDDAERACGRRRRRRSCRAPCATSRR